MRAALVVDLAAATLSRTFHLLSPRLSSGCLPTPKPKKSSSCCKWSVRRALGGTTFLIKSASRADRTARYKGAAVQQTIEHGTVGSYACRMAVTLFKVSPHSMVARYDSHAIDCRRSVC
ncbi:hypothetical protein IWX49DRAFT_255003 [Phyllosticta citricarpa]